MEDCRFGTARSRPWIKKHVRSCGQEFIPAFYRDDVDKILDLMEAAIDMGRKEMFDRWSDLAHPDGLMGVWQIDR